MLEKETSINKGTHSIILDRNILMPIQPVNLADDVIAQWQEIVDLIAGIIGVPAGLVMRLVDDDIEVFVASRTEGNPYKPGDREHFQNSGLYCETVINNKRKLLVPDAFADPEWRNNPDVKLNMISYLGFPLLLPDGSPFGTICVLDSKPNSYSSAYENLIAKMQTIIQNELALYYMNQKLGDQNKKMNDYLEEIKALRQLIPICTNCKKIRDDKGYWNSVETYFERLLGTSFTHGICPDCFKKLYPDFVDEIRNT